MSTFYIKTSGVEPVCANDAKVELEEWVVAERPDLSNQTSTRPFETIPIRTRTTSISEKFQVRKAHLSSRISYSDMKDQQQARTQAAQIMGCSTDQVFFTNHIVMRYNNLDVPQRWVSAAQKGRVITIVALGDLNSDNGLPGFGDPPQFASLTSGQAVHALADTPQHFKGHSTGWALVLSWTRKLSPNMSS